MRCRGLLRRFSGEAACRREAVRCRERRLAGRRQRLPPPAACCPCPCHCPRPLQHRCRRCRPPSAAGVPLLRGIAAAGVVDCEQPLPQLLRLPLLQFMCIRLPLPAAAWLARRFAALTSLWLHADDLWHHWSSCQRRTKQERCCQAQNEGDACQPASAQAIPQGPQFELGALGTTCSQTLHVSACCGSSSGAGWP